jgi:hypothetical protein
MTPKRLVAITATAAIAAGGLEAALALTVGRGSGASPRALAAPSTKASFAYYQTVARRFASGQPRRYGSMMGGGGYGPMMGGSGYSWMTGRPGYTWMMGGTGAPAWKMGGSLPASMMGGATTPAR